MKKLLAISAGLLGMILPLAAQMPQNRVSTPTLKNAAFGWQDQDDRRRHDDDDRDRDRDRDRGRNGRGNQQYQGSLTPDSQRRFDSYYQRWLNYRATNNQEEVRSMEGRMYDIMDHSQIPRNVPFGAIASPGVAGNGGYGQDGPRRGDNDADDYGRGGNYGNGYGRNYHNVLAPEWQQKFDSYYQRWQNYRATNNQEEVRSMEARMRDIMTHYNIPPDVPFGEVSSNGGYGRR